MKFSSNQRGFLADKLMDTANLVLGGLVIGQLVGKDLHMILVIIGLTFYVTTLIVTLSLKRVK